MKIRKVGCFFIILFFITAGQSTIIASSERVNNSEVIKWYSYKKGMALGKSDGKKVYLSFYADWCGFCKVFDNTTYKDPRVISFLNENFISIRVNTDKEKSLAADYRVTGLPSNWFISETGERIGNRPGYIQPKEFLIFLKYVITNSYETMTLNDFMRNIE